ncbi:MAG TPA: TIGR03087 family PEP-CTERM/XrtA system glycosyltransferase [Gemmatimonadota bacterium]|nr:TIGR03087 family PEP-CTERM/XrtA system glycosyltransferase [Gemmatimonadota bacterium]
MTKQNRHCTSKLTILYVTHSLPYPPTKGEKIRVFHQVRELAREHQVHLVCGVERSDDVAGVDALARICASVTPVPISRLATRLRAAQAFVTGRSRSAHSHNSAELRRAVERTLGSGRFDAILASSVGVAECVRWVDTIPKAIDFVDATSELWKATADNQRFPLSWLHRLEAGRLARYEADVARRFDSAIVVSETEAKILRRQAADVTIAVVGNGVDLEAFTPAPALHRPPPNIVFTGTMDYSPNVDAVRYFCDAVLPRVRHAVPTVRFTIVGRRPTRAVWRLRRHGQVTVTGSVPDVRPYLLQAAVAVAPFRFARGIQNKILESMASGVPVVGTSLVLDALEVTDEHGARRADDPASFAREVVTLLLDPEWRAVCSRRARSFVEHRHRWDMHSPSWHLKAMVETWHRASSGG